MKTILCYGDSNTYGTRPDGLGRWNETVRWPCLLQKKLGESWHVIEEGCGYRTTVFDDPIEPYKNGRTYLSPCLYSHRPLDLVIIMLGTNDMKARFSATATDIAQGAKVLADLVQNFDYQNGNKTPKVLVACPVTLGEEICKGPFKGSFGPDAYQKSLLLWQEFQEVFSSTEYALCNAGAWASPSELDQIHLDAEGHAFLAQGFYEIIREMLD